MVAEVTLVAGLPGSGKTSYLSRMEREGWLIFDDYKAEAFEDCSKFRSSKHFSRLTNAVRAGSKCVVADINFCRKESQEEAERELLTEVPGAKVSWCCFENNPFACAVNIRKRPGRSDSQREQELGYLEEYSPVYHFPRGAAILPVWREQG